MQITVDSYDENKSGFSFPGMIDKKQLKKLQDKFCEIAGIFAFCMGGNGNSITEMSGRPEEVEKLQNQVGGESFLSVYRRITESTLEEQIVEDTVYPNVKIASICVKVQGKPILYWLICGVLTDVGETGSVGEPITGIETVITEKKFYQSIDLIRIVSTKVYAAEHSLVSAEAESRRSQSSAQEMSEALKRIEAVTEIVQLLESSDAIEAVIGQVLQIAGEYLNISSAEVFRFRRDKISMDIMSEWTENGITSLFDKTQNIKRYETFESDKPLVLSSNTKKTPIIIEEMEKGHIKALVTMPIFINGQYSMCVCFNECTKERLWQLEEIKFMNDVSKLLQTIIVKRIQKNSLAGSYASLEMILDNVGSGIYVRDVESHEVLFANKVLKSTFEIEIKEETLDILIEKAIPVGNQEGYYEIKHIARRRWYDLYNRYITWVDGRKVSLCAFYDVTDKKIYQRKIEQQAYTDFLTGLYNRMCCERDLAWHIDTAKHDNTQGALLYLDLDDFKHINDGLGHQYGDVLLKAISHSLQRIDGINNTCYRMGGDEFVIVIPPESYLKFEPIVEEIKNIFNKPWFLKDADYYCTMSMGIVKFPDEGESVQELIKKADIAMYEAKKSGKNRVAFYSQNIFSSSNKRLDMEKNMRDATLAGYREFEVYYQPIIDIQLPGTPCTGAEALIRWNSSELGFISPSDFIPLAEYLGLINPIGNHVLLEACRACKQWNDHGHPNYKVNVNLSVVQLLQTDIVEIVARSLAETEINPKNLTLEVTESLAINDMERMCDILSSIKALGVRIALDDFGTGYSSLNHIREIPLDVIKVDLCFVTDLAEDTYSQSFIKMVAELAGTIGVSICVEGIETKEQYKVLEGMQVRLIQGYYFDRPMTKTDFENKYVKTEEK